MKKCNTTKSQKLFFRIICKLRLRNQLLVQAFNSKVLNLWKWCKVDHRHLGLRMANRPWVPDLKVPCIDLKLLKTSISKMWMIWVDIISYQRDAIWRLPDSSKLKNKVKSLTSLGLQRAQGVAYTMPQTPIWALIKSARITQRKRFKYTFKSFKKRSRWPSGKSTNIKLEIYMRIS